MDGVRPAGGGQGYLGEVMVENPQLTEDEIELCVKFAVQRLRPTKVEINDIEQNVYSLRTDDSVKRYIELFRSQYQNLRNNSPKTIYFRNIEFYGIDFSRATPYLNNRYYSYSAQFSDCILKKCSNIPLEDAIDTVFEGKNTFESRNIKLRGCTANSIENIKSFDIDENCRIDTLVAKATEPLAEFTAKNSTIKTLEVSNANRLILSNIQGLTQANLSAGYILLENSDGKNIKASAATKGTVNIVGQETKIHNLEISANRAAIIGAEVTDLKCTSLFLTTGHSTIIKGSSPQFIGTSALNLSDTTFEGKPQFTDCAFDKHAIFSQVTFKHCPSFSENTRFAGKNVEFEKCTFNELKGGAALGGYRKIKSMCQEADYEHGVILFHGYELETYYNTSLKGLYSIEAWPEKFSHWLHKAFTDYGRDVMRPFLCLILLFFLAADFYVGLEKLGIAGFENLNTSNSLSLSFKHSVGPMAFALNSDYWKDLPQPDPDFFGFFHIITSSIIWFLIIFMIRRRFKI